MSYIREFIFQIFQFKLEQTIFLLTFFLSFFQLNQEVAVLFLSRPENLNLSQKNEKVKNAIAKIQKLSLPTKGKVPKQSAELG